ncbi:tautomerase family protein [Rhodococcus sp. D2-41]|uniref:Tautomerase family protein n=1 Tax=Speluncibacter jeojiensis TaxID=2710754 RepID=A0A9X4RCI1_9ACTN|nr:tautomerase family protein [Rhodococcus sp. D2-41]MDG3012073.1 tautomerase family protein [Rhodococcus sp. D2-41]MDG3013598.1 tautomerase family protein [Corynebacteriales bacterium D3-21]
MPLITIELMTGTTVEHRKAISDGLHEAMQEILDIPDDDRFHVFHELSEGDLVHEPVVFGIPRTTSRMLLITLSFNERSPEQKNALFAAVVRRLEEHAGVRRDELPLRVVETARENWWGDGRVVNPQTGYDERMTPAVP